MRGKLAQLTKYDCRSRIVSVHDIFKHEEQGQHIHHRRELPETAGDDLHRHVGEEAEHDALGDAGRERHDDDGDEGG